MKRKTKITLTIIAIITLAALWLQSTAWFRLQLADYYQQRGEDKKAVQLYEKVLRKDSIETKNPLVFKDSLTKKEKNEIGKTIITSQYDFNSMEEKKKYYKIFKDFFPEKVENYYLYYYLVNDVEKLVSIIVEEPKLKKNIPSQFMDTSLWKFNLAKILAKKKRWKESESIFKELVQNYPYLYTFKDSVEYVKNKRVPKQSFTIVGIWNFDQGKGDIAKDLSGMGNNGKIKDAKWVKKKQGYALKFDSKDDTVIFPDNKSFYLDGKDFTIAMRVKPFLHNKYRFVYWKWRPNLYLHKNNNIWSFAVQDGQGNKKVQIKHPIENKWYFVVQSVKQDRWHKVWLFDAEGLIETVSRKDIGITEGADGSSLKVSRKGWHKENNDSFTGEIDDIFLFKEALSDMDVKKLYGSIKMRR